MPVKKNAIPSALGKGAPNDVQTVVRLPSSMLRELDTLAEKMSEPGIRITRASVIRMLILRGMAAESITTSVPACGPSEARARR